MLLQQEPPQGMALCDGLPVRSCVAGVSSANLIVLHSDVHERILAQVPSLSPRCRQLIFPRVHRCECDEVTSLASWAAVLRAFVLQSHPPPVACPSPSCFVLQPKC